MSDDSWFWAGVSGKRAESIAALEQDVRAWRRHCEQLENTIDELRRSRLYWYTGTVHEGANAQVFADAFKERTGETLAQHFGKNEIRKRVEAQKEVEHKGTFLKKWDPTL